MAQRLRELLPESVRREHAAYLPQLTPPDAICLHLGYPDPRIFPVEAVRTAFQVVADSDLRAGLQYCEEAGDRPLRETLSARAGVGEDCVLVTQGTTEAIEIVVRLLLQPGDTIVMEEPSYLWAIRVFKYAGARLVGVPVDGEGLCVSDLEATIRQMQDAGHRVKFVYTIPDSQNPSGATMSLERRHELIRIAASTGVVVFEDNPYWDLRYGGAPLPTLRRLDRADVVVSARSFSKTVGPGIRLGWLEAAPDLLGELVRMKQTGSCTLVSRMVDSLIRSGAFDRIVDAVTAHYAVKHAAMRDALTEFMPPSAVWHVPAGGFYFWVRLPEAIDLQTLYAECATDGVLFLKGDDFFCGTVRERALRLSFSYETPERIRHGVRRLGAHVAQYC